MIHTVTVDHLLMFARCVQYGSWHQAMGKMQNLEDQIMYLISEIQSDYFGSRQAWIEVSKEQIKEAFENGKAVLVHGRRENGSSTCLRLDGQHFDNRGECYSMWEEMWTTKPKSYMQCLALARCDL